MKRDPKQSGDHLDAFLKAGDPVEPSALSGDGIESALDEIGAEITGRSRQATSRRARWLSISKPRAALLIGFATIGIGAAIAGGSLLSAHTGHFKPTVGEIAQVAKTNPEKAKTMQGEVGGGGPGEDLNPAGADFAEIYRQLSSDIPFPKGYESWRDSLIAEDVKSMKKDVEDANAAPDSYKKKWGVEMRVTSGAIHGWFAMSAFCAWVLDWRYAEISGDTQAAAQATQVISEAPSWKAVTDEDPYPDPNALGDSNGSSYYSMFGWMLPYRDAVLAGDRARVEHLLTTVYFQGTCQAYDPDWRAIEDPHSRARDSNWLDNLEKHYRQYLASRTS